MAIIYTLRKKQDEQVLVVSQDTTYTLTYTSDGSSEVIATETILSGTILNLLIPKDGAYSLVLSAPTETNVIETFNVIKYLQDSIAADVLTLLCTCNQPYENTDCKTRSEKEAIATRSLSTKLSAFQASYIPLYGSDYLLNFATYLSESGTLLQCDLQTTINNLLLEECVTGCVGSISRLSKLYTTMYWSWMYFTERSLINTSVADDLAFLNTKFNYSDISACICELGIKITDLDNLYVTQPTLIHSFQYTSTAETIADIAIVDSTFLIDRGTLHTEASLLAGINITFTRIARIGFSIETTVEDPFQIFDINNNNITTTGFDRQYDSGRGIAFYVSKNIVTPSTLFFKFTKN